MRVSDQQLFGILMTSMQQARATLLAAQTQLASGKRVNAPSDDPVAYSRLVERNASLAQMDQWLRNAQAGAGQLQMADHTLTAVTNVLARAKTLAVQLSSDLSGPPARAAGAGEIRQLLFELQGLANTTTDGQALFTGTSTRGRATGTTLTTPVTITGGSTDTLHVSVDGIASGVITLPAGTYSGPAAAALVEAQINTDATLRAAGKRVTVTYEDGRLVIVSTSAGPRSTVTVTGGTARGELGFNGGSTTTGAAPYALQAFATAAPTNTGDATISQGQIDDATQATLNDYVIKFESASSVSVYNVSAPVTATAASTNRGQMRVASATVVDPTALTLDDYEIVFTSDTQYTIRDRTTGAVVSSDNAYQSGAAITFDGLRVILQDGPGGGPQRGDTVAVAVASTVVQAHQPYVSGQAIRFDGLAVTLTSGPTGPAAGDRYAVRTGLQYQGNTGLPRIPIDAGPPVMTTLPGQAVFSGPTTDLFASLKRLLTALQGQDRDGITQSVSALDQAIAQVTGAQAQLGAAANRLKTTQDDLTTARDALAQARAQDQDADISQVVTALATQEYAIQAAQAALARLLQTSLLQFLR
ncbi:flagellin N-terminal helical domain-containing protein [Nitrospira sp. Kam-Ns4a]